MIHILQSFSSLLFSQLSCKSFIHIHPSMVVINKFLQFPSPFLNSHLNFLHKIPLLPRQPSLIPNLSSSSSSSSSNSPDFLIISTSLQSDGSLVFKFGDATQIPPPLENDVQLETQSDANLAPTDHDHAHPIELEKNVEEDVVSDEIKEQTQASCIKDDQNCDQTIEDEDDIMSETESGFNLGNLDAEAIGVGMPVPPQQLQAQPILDEEVNHAGLPSIAQLDDSPGGDNADAAFSSLEASMVILDTNVDREKISSHTEGISAISPPMPSTSYQVNDAVPSDIRQPNDDQESRDISEPAGPVPESSGTASEEAHLDSVQTSIVVPSVPSAMESILQATEVNDPIIPSIQLSDGDRGSDISVTANPGSGISATEEINLRVENSAPSLRVVSAAASLAHSQEALAGGADVYFVCDNWFGVADDVGQWTFGGIEKGLYAQELIQNCETLATKSLNTGLSSLRELLQQSASMTKSPGAARVLIAHIADQVLHVANIGDSGFIVVRKGTVFRKSSPMFHEFNFPYAVSSGDNPVEAVEEYHVELEDGDIIVTATDGLFDNIYEHEIASLVCKAVEDGTNVKDVAELLASRSQEVGRSPNVRTPFADAAQAAGHTEFSGGKFDHVTVIVSTVQIE